MPLLSASPPIAVHTYGGFDYVAVDARRHRVYAAHTGSHRLLIVDATSGKELGQVDVGPVHGVAVDESTGMVFTGDGTDDNVMKVDPMSEKIVGEADVAGPVDAIAYDPATHRIYADEDSGTVVYVVDSRTMKSIGKVPLPGHDEEFLAVDPATHVVYQNVPDLAEFVEIDPRTLRVTKVVKTPMLSKDHPLQYDATYHEVVVGGKNGIVAAYTPVRTIPRADVVPNGRRPMQPRPGLTRSRVRRRRGHLRASITSEYGSDTGRDATRRGRRTHRGNGRLRYRLDGADATRPRRRRAFPAEVDRARTFRCVTSGTAT